MKSWKGWFQPHIPERVRAYFEEGLHTGAVGRIESDIFPNCANFPVEVVEHCLSVDERLYPQCEELMREIGTAVWEILKLIPAKSVLLWDIYYFRRKRKRS